MRLFFVYLVLQFIALAQPIKIGETCTENKDCSDTIANSECPDNTSKRVCACKLHYKENSDKTKCEQAIGTPCKYDADCEAVKDAVCSDSPVGITCICKEDLIATLDYKTCAEKAKKDGDNYICAESENCGFIRDYSVEDAVVAATCDSNKKCKCSKDDWFIHYVKDQTYISCERKLGTACDKDEECTAGISNSSCKDDTCQCSSGYEDDKNKAKCNKKSSGAASVVSSTVVFSILALITKLAA